MIPSSLIKSVRSSTLAISFFGFSSLSLVAQQAAQQPTNTLPTEPEPYENPADPDGLSPAASNYDPNSNLRWMELIAMGEEDFRVIRDTFEILNTDIPYTQRRGYKQFSRLEELYRSRIDEDGRFNPTEAYIEYQRWFRAGGDEGHARASANWTNFGPATSPVFYNLPSQQGIGRVARISFHPTDANTLYVSAVYGGLWKTTDGGTTWTAIGDFLPSILQAGDVVVDPVDDDILYFATSNDDQFSGGAGVYKSTDGGTTWTYLALTGIKIDRLVMDPSDRTHLWAATAGGLYESTDSGGTWSLHSSFTSGYVQAFFYKPGSSTTIYLSHVEAGGVRFYRSTDSGVSWTAVALPMAHTNFAQMELAVTEDDVNYVYAFGASATPSNCGIFKSTDSGATWTQIASESTAVTYQNSSAFSSTFFTTLTVYLARCVTIGVSSIDKDEVYVGSARMFRTTDGGTTWEDYQEDGNGASGTVHHYDNIHTAWNPVDDAAYFCNDGSVYKRTGGAGGTLVDIADGIKITENYWINTSHDGTKFICGNQDNGTFLYNGTDWSHIGSGDGMVCFFDPSDDNITYHSYQVGLGIVKIMNGAVGGGETAGEATNVFNQTKAGGQVASWVTQYALHPIDNHVLYVAYEDVFKSEDQGATWTNQTSGSVNTNAKELLRISKADPDLIVVGDIYQDQEYYKSTDGGSTWSEITSLAGVWVGDILLHPTDANKMWYCKHSEVFESTDQGATWTSISTGLPSIPANCLAYQDGTGGGLYLGMELGVYWRADTDVSWSLFTNSDLPNVIVSDIEMVPATGKVRVGTKQRSTWESNPFNTFAGCYQASVPTVTSSNCSGTITLTASAAPSGYTHQWYKDGAAIGGATNALYTVTTSGRYVVVFVNGSCKSPGSTPRNIDVSAPTLPTVGSGCTAMNFDGTDDGLEITPSAALVVGDDFTMEFWMKNSAASTGVDDIILKPYAYGVTVSGTQMNFITWGDDAGFAGALNTDDEWHHYAFVASGGTSRKLYIDGVLFSENTSAYSTGTGGGNLTIADGWDGEFACTLDELRIWGVARSASEIADNYEEAMDCFDDDLRLYLSFEDGTADSDNSGLSYVFDHSVYGHKVVLNNMAQTGSASNWVGGNSRTWYQDSDGDGWGSTTVSQTSCVQPTGYILISGDCDDTDSNIHPYADEVCGNSDDDDCDGNTDVMVNKCLDLDGTDDYITLSNPFPHQHNCTMEAWIKTSTASGTIMGWNGTNSAVIVIVDASTLGYYENGGGYNFGGAVADGNWHHIAVVRTSTHALVYRDGVLIGNLPFANTLSTSSFTIGANVSGGSLITGQIDEVRIWDAALSQTQISDRKDMRLDGNETNLVRYYHFDHGKAGLTNSDLTTLQDGTANSGDGTLRGFALSGSTSNWVSSWTYPTLYSDGDSDGVGNNTAWTCGTMTDFLATTGDCDDSDANINPNLSDVIGDASDNNCNSLSEEDHALHFDGSNDVVTTAHIPEILTANGTIELWIKPELKGSSMTFICLRNSAGNSTRWLFNFGANLGFLGFWNGAGYQTISNTFTAGTWQHMAIVDDGTNTKVYRNGTLMGTFTLQFNTAASGTDLLLVMGHDIPLSEYYQGALDEVRIWSTVRTSSEINTYMNERICETTTGLEVYFPFDQGYLEGANSSITKLDDIGSGDNNGTLSGFGLSGSTGNFIAGAGVTTPTWYLDADSDTYYTGSAMTQACSPGAGYNRTSTNAGDCDDSNALLTTSCTSYTWTGNTSTDWDNIGNWHGGAVPSVSDDVTIPSAPANQPHVTAAPASPATCDDLTVQSGATLTIDAGKALTALGSTTNDGTILIKADATGIGSFIDNGLSGSGSFQMEQYLTGSGGATPSGLFWYVSSPITDGTAAVYNAAGTDRFWSANEVSQSYPEITSDATSLTVGQGYISRLGATSTLTFDGSSYNTGSISTSGLTRTGTTSNNRGYNLMGNPYTSSVDWEAATRTNLSTTMWYRTKNGSTMLVDTYNATTHLGTNNNGGGAVTQYIPPTQAFWVRVDADGNTGTLGFTNADRSHPLVSGLYRMNGGTDIIRIIINDGTTSDEHIVLFNPAASDGYDPFDSDKLFGSLTQPYLFSSVAGQDLTMNGLNSPSTTPSLPLSIFVPSSGDYTLEGIEFTNPSLMVVLEDADLSVFQDLMINPTYSFNSADGWNHDRFILHFNLTVTELEERAKTDLKIFNNDQGLNIHLGNEDAGTYTILDMTGRVVDQGSLISNRSTLQLDVVPGVYVVQVVTSTESYSQQTHLD